MMQKKIVIKGSKREKDFMVHYPVRADGCLMQELLRPWKMIHPTSLFKTWATETGYKEVDCYKGSIGLYSYIEMDWIKELDRRGYDTTTLKFEIKMKPAREEKLSGEGK